MKRVVFASILALLIISGIAFSYFYYQRYKVPQAEPLTLVPADACFVIRINNFHTTSDHLKENSAWKLLSGFSAFDHANAGMLFLDSLLKQNDKLNSALEDHPLYVSAHIAGAEGINFLFLTSLPKTGQESFVNEVIVGIFGIQNSFSKRVYQGEIIKEMEVNGKVFSYTFTRGILACSFDAVLVEDAIRQSKQAQSSFKENDFEKVYQAAGKKVDANFFFRYESFSKLIGLLANTENKNLAMPFAHTAAWSGLDLKTKENSISLSGYTSFKDTTDYYSIFTGQQPQSMQLLNILPKRTAMLAYTSFNKLDMYLKKVSIFRKQSGLTSSMKTPAELSKEYGINIEEKFVNVVGNEFALVVTEPGSGNLENHAYAIFNCGNISRAKKNLNELTAAAQGKEASSTKNFVPERSEEYKGRTIGFLGINNMLPVLFGNDFEKMERVFYTFINDYVIFANQASSLRSFIDDFDAKKMMINDPGYQAIASTLSAKSNRFIYINIQRFASVFRSLAQDGVSESLQHNADLQKGYSAITLQASVDGKLIYTHTLLHHSPVKKSDSALLWSARLDTSISSEPHLVINPKTGERQVFVQDDNNTIYLIGNDGEIIWKDSLNEKIMSDVYQVDYYRNDKYQFLFNTTSKIYLIDRKGERNKNYPVTLSAKATAGLVVFDYDKKKDYRIFIPTADHKLNALQLNTKPIEGWYFKGALDYVAFPVQYFKLADKDFLVVSDTTGAVFLLDRKGKPRAIVDEKINAHFTRPFLLETGKTIESSRLVTTDGNGKIISVYFNGSVSMTKFREVQPAHFFDMADVNADSSPDYIFLEANVLHVFNQDSSPIFSHTFNEEIKQKPIVFHSAGSKSKIGVVSSTANEFYLFNDDGSIYEGFPLKGSTGFTIDNTAPDNKLNVLVGSSDKNVYMYSLE